MNPLTVLLVDDNPDDRTLLVRELRREFPGLEVNSATNPREYNTILRNEQLDLVITDYQLHWIDGLSVLRQVKARWPDCPVIMFTATGGEEVAVAALKAGLDDYVIKSPRHYARIPGSARALLRRVESDRRAVRLESRLEQLMNRLNVGVFRTTLAGDLIDSNPSFQRLFGLDLAGDEPSLSLSDLFRESPDWAQLSYRLACGDPIRNEPLRAETREGSKLWVSLTLSRNVLADGVSFVDGLVEDINERRLAEAALSTSQERFRKLAAISAQDKARRSRIEGVLRNIAEGVSACTGAVFFRMLAGYLAKTLEIDCVVIGELPGVESTQIKTLAIFHSGQDQANIEYPIEGTPCGDVLNNGQRESCCRVQSKFPGDARLGLWDVDWYLGMPLKDKNDNSIGVIAVAHRSPPTDRELVETTLEVFSVRASAELRRRQSEDESRLNQVRLANVARLNAIGEMASSLAHEINQPLAAISNFAHGCIGRLQYGTVDSEKTAEILELIASEADRAGGIIRQLRKFIRRGEPAREPVDVPEMIRGVVSCLELETRRNKIRINLQFDGNQLIVEGDKIQLEQVIVNLVLNGIEAMYDSRLGKDLLIRSRQLSDGQVEILVEDRGPGIPDQIADRLFEPFTTAKPHGLGLGLSISNSIIESHGGSMWARNRSEGGAVFGLRMPAFENA